MQRPSYVSPETDVFHHAETPLAGQLDFAAVSTPRELTVAIAQIPLDKLWEHNYQDPTKPIHHQGITIARHAAYTKALALSGNPDTTRDEVERATTIGLVSCVAGWCKTGRSLEDTNAEMSLAFMPLPDSHVMPALSKLLEHIAMTQQTLSACHPKPNTPPHLVEQLQHAYFLLASRAYDANGAIQWRVNPATGEAFQISKLAQLNTARRDEQLLPVATAILRDEFHGVTPPDLSRHVRTHFTAIHLAKSPIYVLAGMSALAPTTAAASGNLQMPLQLSGNTVVSPQLTAVGTYKTVKVPDLGEIATLDPPATLPQLNLHGAAKPQQPPAPEAVSPEQTLKEDTDPVEAFGGKKAAEAEDTNSNAPKPTLRSSNYALYQAVDSALNQLPEQSDETTRTIAAIVRKGIDDPASLQDLMSNENPDSLALISGKTLDLDSRLVDQEREAVMKIFATKEYGFNTEKNKYPSLSRVQTSTLFCLIAVMRLSTLTDEEIKSRTETLPPVEPEPPKDPAPIPPPDGEIKAPQDIEKSIKGYFNQYGNDLTAQQRKFLEPVIRGVLLELNKGAKVSPQVVITQAAHESAWGQSGLAKKANNLFGVKAGSNWKGKTITLSTWEVINGENVTVDAKWRVYDTIEDAINDYMLLIGNQENFADAMRCASEPGSYLDGLLAKLNENDCGIRIPQGKEGAGSYATDPRYKSKILTGIKALHLEHFAKFAPDKVEAPPIVSVESFPSPADVTASPAAAKAECDRLGIKYIGVEQGYRDGKAVAVYLCEMPEKYWYGKPRHLNVTMAARMIYVLESMWEQGYKVTLNSDFRTNEEQIEARERNGCGGPENPSSACTGDPVARPTFSNHQSGEAADGGINGVLIRERGTKLQKAFIKAAHEAGLEDIAPEAWHLQLPKELQLQGREAVRDTDSSSTATYVSHTPPDSKPTQLKKLEPTKLSLSTSTNVSSSFITPPPNEQVSSTSEAPATTTTNQQDNHPATNNGQSAAAPQTSVDETNVFEKAAGALGKMFNELTK